jgi:hypothetical protein
MTPHSLAATVRRVNEAEALERLPYAYAHALQLWRKGTDRASIANELGIQLEAVDALLRIANAKLAALTSSEGSPQENT